LGFNKVLEYIYGSFENNRPLGWQLKLKGNKNEKATCKISIDE
jgi:hypothetical protein